MIGHAAGRTIAASAIVMLLATAAGAQPLIFRSQSRVISASGMCCGGVTQSDSFAETGTALSFNASLGVDEFVDPYHYYSADAAQTTTISPTGVSGRTFASAFARGVTSPSSSVADSVCEVTFAVEVPCHFTFTGASDAGQVYVFGSTYSLYAEGGVRVMNGSITNEHRSATVTGGISPGEYTLTVDSFASGTQFGLTSTCNFSFELTPECACDWDGSAALDSGDFFAFLTDFFAGNADFNGSGSTDSQDFFAFLECFFVGCA